jgi:outer membrane beta-barrel protein
MFEGKCMRSAFLMAMIVILFLGKTALSLDEGIYVVQPKATALASRFETVLAGVYNLNNRYVSEGGLALAVLYHVRENLAAELQGNWFLKRQNSEIYEKITALSFSDVKNAFAAVNYYRATWLINAAMEWCLLYGKLAFHNVGLGDVGVYTLAGIGVMGLELADSAERVLPFQLTTPFGAGLRVYFARHFGLRLEVRNNVQVLWIPQATVNSASSFYNISHKIWLTLGVTYVF